MIMTRTRRWTALAAAALTAAGLTACTHSSGGGTTTAAAGNPVKGGTLRILTNGGPDHLDPVSSYNSADDILEKAYARELVNYPTPVTPLTSPSGPGWRKATTVVPDVATVVPTKANGGISANGRVYTFHIRTGVMWNTTPPRQVTAADFIREFKAFCNPVEPVGNVLYYDSTISGFQSYCNAEAAHFAAKNAPNATAAAIAGWQNSHTISGVSATSPLTLKITLTQPANDFLNIMALPFAAARPAEYDGYVPDSAQFRAHIISDGPYRITSYVPGKSITMSRNPAWRQSSDPLRHQYVNKITVTLGVGSSQTEIADFQAGTADIGLGDLPVPPTSIPGMLATHDTRLHIWPSSALNPYLWFNLRSPDSGGAMGKLLVRQAVEYGVDKADLQKVLGGPSINKIVSMAIPPGNVGYQASNPYPTAGNQGNPAKCKSLLAQAGYPHGFTAVFVYLDDPVGTSVYQSIQAGLSKCGITLKGKPETNATFGAALGNAPQNNKPDQWDMAPAAWTPDWFGNNGRTFIQPLFYTNCTLNSPNFGCYSNPAVDSLITRALKAPDAATAGPLWAQADTDVMKDAVIAPLIDPYIPVYASSRVKSAGLSTANYNYGIDGPDITNIWLNPPHP
jgi:peptide/nickel transport system substrate-binding protein